MRNLTDFALRLEYERVKDLGDKLVLHNINFAILDNAFGVCLWHCPF